ncbi:MAG: TIGR02678 family protein [Nocardioidaceae bacterium]
MPERPAPAPDLATEAEIRAAARALLRTPLLHDEAGSDELRLVRKHRRELERLFSEGLGYRLVVEPGVARLFKTGLGQDRTRPLRRRSGATFTPRGYALLALTLAALTRCRSQLMVDELVSQIRSAAADAGIAVDLDGLADRRALHGALTALCELGVIRERDGDLEHWADKQTASLLDVRRDRLALLVAAPLGGCENAGDVVRVTAVPSAVGGARVAVRRHLTERPVLSASDLTEEHAEWWSRNRRREREWFRHRLGLDLELRAEGAVAIDPQGELTDRAFPAGGSTRHFALLLLETLVNELRSIHGRALHGREWVRVPEETVQRLAAKVFDQWRDGFRKQHREDPRALHDEATGVLQETGLLAATEAGDVLVHAAAARFAARPALVESAPSGERSLFDEEDS